MAKRRSYNPGRWQTERERGQIARHAPAPAFDPIRPLGDVVAGVLRNLKIQAPEEGPGPMVEEWPSLVGEAVAKHSRPGRIQKAHLVVFVDSYVWLTELARYGKDQMLANLQKRFGRDKIKTLSYQLDPDGTKG